MSVNDRIERDVFIAADAARVWAVLTEPEHIGMWFGNGEPGEIDLRPGGRIVFDHGDQGKLPAIIEHVDELKSLSFRWAADDTGGEPTRRNATLVEFTLTPEGTGTRLRVVERGFSKVEAEDPAVVERRYKANAGGWGTAIRGLAAYLERPDGDEFEEFDGDGQPGRDGHGGCDGIAGADHGEIEASEEVVLEEVDAI